MFDSCSDEIKVESNYVHVTKTEFPLREMCPKSPDETLCSNDCQNNTTKAGINNGENRDKSAKDSQYRCTANYWQVASIISCFIANVLSGGILNSYGVLYTYMQESLGVSEYQISWIGSLTTGFHGLAALLATITIDNKGCRITTLLGTVFAASGFVISSQTSNIYVLYLTLGVLPGIGVCLAFAATLVHLNRQFTRWRPFAVSLSVVGTALGILLWPPLTSGIAEIMGWRGALLINGGLLLHLMPCALLIKPEAKHTANFKNDQTTSKLQSIRNYFEIFRTRGTLTVCTEKFFTGLSYYSFSAFAPNYVMTSLVDTTATKAAWIISLAGFGSIAGRVLAAGASMVHVKAPETIYTISLFMCAISTFIVTLCHNMTSHLINGAFNGFGVGGVSSMSSVVYVNLFGIEKLSQTFGLFNACLGFGAVCGPPLESYMSSVFGIPELTFYCAGSFYIISTILFLSLIARKKRFVGKTKSVNIDDVGVGNPGFTADATVESRLTVRL